MTNFKCLQSMNVEELAEWLDENGSFEDSPWLNSFNEKYCSKCESVEISYKDVKEKLNLEPWFGHTTKCAFCELEPKKCRFFPDLDDVPGNFEMIKMWLIEETENEIV